MWKEAAVVNLRYYSGICLDGLREITKTLSQDNINGDCNR
jgi:hypothetical protein